MDIQSIREEIRMAKRLVFLGGAGVSTASGIPDFRSPEGLYRIQSKYGVPYEVMLSHSYFEAHPSTFYDFYWSTMVYPKAKPNRAHAALARYEKAGHRVAILTQNIDGLHQEAGSTLVYELHGSTKHYHCVNCMAHYSLAELVPNGVPHCQKCGGILKPDVVLYEEPLDEECLESAVNEMRFANFLIVGGTSLKVYPAAALPDFMMGGKKILINREPTPLDHSFDVVWHEDIGTALEKLLG